MTMLDRMRRHKNWLKWSLAIVVVSFVLLYIPSFMGAGAPGVAAGNAVVADVEGRQITATQFRRVYQQQMQAYRQSYGANVDDRLLKQLGIDQRIVQQMIQEEASLAEAKRLGIKASDAEVRERILSLPAFQENGLFIGDKRKIRYLTIDQEALRQRATVTGQQIERSYNDNIQQYSTPEQVRASHILLKTCLLYTSDAADE